LTGLLAKIRPAIAAAGCHDASDDACVTSVAGKNVLQSMREIRERSAYLASDLQEGKLELVGAMYDVSTGKVTLLRPDGS
jgi:carbonic anhydrase